MSESTLWRTIRAMRSRLGSSPAGTGASTFPARIRHAEMQGAALPVNRRVDEAIRDAAALAAMSVTSERELLSALDRIRRGEEQGPVMWELHSGLLGFLDSVFPGSERPFLYGQVFSREPQGRGSHFDVYDDFLDPGYPWVALFNLAGDAVVSVFRLPDEPARRYAVEHPVASDEAYLERRRIAEAALADPTIHLDRGLLLAGRGLIIPQQVSGPDWVHDVIPLREEDPGRFVKFAVGLQGSSRELIERGYSPVDGLFRHALLHAPAEGSGDSEIRRRRRCNLD